MTTTSFPPEFLPFIRWLAWRLAGLSRVGRAGQPPPRSNRPSTRCLMPLFNRFLGASQHMRSRGIGRRSWAILWSRFSSRDHEATVLAVKSRVEASRAWAVCRSTARKTERMLCTSGAIACRLNLLVGQFLAPSFLGLTSVSSA